MEQLARQIIEKAIREEEYFAEFYRKAAGRAELSSAKKLLMMLAEQEEMHRKKLMGLGEGLKLDKTGSLMEKVKLAEELMLLPINEFRGTIEIFRYAVKSEQLAAAMYGAMAGASGDAEAEKLFRWLASEEKKHESFLREQLELMTK